MQGKKVREVARMTDLKRTITGFKKIFGLKIITFYRNQFKCGAFFVKLHGQSERLRWISALPDILVKASVRKSTELMRSFNNVKKKSFRVPRKDCSETEANRK